MLSIIVPIYNVAQYLRHCLQSLTEQGLEDYEVILVNDASRDNCRAICSEWCQEHPKFRLINHEVNRGLSEARNTGIQEAQGEWITFVDSDDFLDTDTLSHVMRTQDKGVDVLEYPVMEYHLSNHSYFRTFQREDLDFGAWLQQGGHKHCYAPNKVFRRSLWQDIRFPEGRHYEDIFTIPKVLKKARIIRTLDKGCYYYCEHSGSICTTMAEQTLLDYLDAYNALLDMPEAMGNHDLYLRARNGEINYKRMFGKKTRNTGDAMKKHIIRRRPMPFRFAFAKGLTMNDRIKVIWMALGG